MGNALVWQNLVQLHLVHQNSTILMKWHSYTRKVVTRLVKAIYSYDQLSFSPPFSHVHAKFPQKSNTNTVSQFSGLPWKNWKVDEIKKHLSRRFYLKGDMMKLYPFIQGSLEWPCSELFSANVSLSNHCNYLAFNAFSCGILNISYKTLLIRGIFNEKTNKSNKYRVLCRNVITFYRRELRSSF